MLKYDGGFYVPYAGGRQYIYWRRVGGRPYAMVAYGAKEKAILAFVTDWSMRIC